jgi:vanillate O-demethylase ferredoxin subunit
MAATNVEVWQRGTVIEARNVTPEIRRIVLRAERPAKAAPGSHIDVRLNIDGQVIKRSYSVVESSETGDSLVISVLKAPLSRGGSIYLHGLQPGDELEFTQPLQNFPLRVGADHYLLLAGGIGITAIMNMAVVLRNLRMDYSFVYAGRSRQAMAYLSELEDLHGNRLIVHVDDEGTSLNVEQLVAGAGENTELYVCGPIRLMDAVRRAWSQRGLSSPSLRYETFGNSGWYDPEDFLVRVPSLGLEVTVGQDRSMLEALEDAGLEMMFDCRKGECGLCEVRITSLDGAIDHRDVFYSTRQKNAERKVACCVSRAVTSKTGLIQDAATSGPAIVSIEVP